MRKKSTSRTKKNRPKTKLGIPDLEHSKAAVLRSFGSPDSQRAACALLHELEFSDAPLSSPRNRMYENEPGRKPLSIELHRLRRFPCTRSFKYFHASRRHAIVSGLEEATHMRC
jgi:hypothetical protein